MAFVVNHLFFYFWYACPFQHWPLFTDITELYILVPSLLGLKGNLEMTLSSRLSTAVSCVYSPCVCVCTNPPSNRFMLLGSDTPNSKNVTFNCPCSIITIVIFQTTSYREVHSGIFCLSHAHSPVLSYIASVT